MDEETNNTETQVNIERVVVANCGLCIHFEPFLFGTP